MYKTLKQYNSLRLFESITLYNSFEVYTVEGKTYALDTKVQRQFVHYVTVLLYTHHKFKMRALLASCHEKPFLR